MLTSNATSEKYLDPHVLASISGLEMRARLAVEGFLTGRHRSARRGVSVEFADHRIYAQGDDLRHIDWKVFGRTDKYYIKEYEQETNLELVLVVDCSESMNYRSRSAAMSKMDYAASLAAAIAHLALRQQDAVGIATFDEKIRRYVRPSTNTQQWRMLVQALSDRSGPAKTSIEHVLNELAERLQRRSIVILISDLFDDAPGVVKGLRRLRYHRHEPIVWNVWDDAELTFPFTHPTMFDGMEKDGTLLTEPFSIRERYLAEVDRFRSYLSSKCSRMQVEYTSFTTSSSLGVSLANYLATRNARLRQRSARAVGHG